MPFPQEVLKISVPKMILKYTLVTLLPGASELTKSIGYSLRHAENFSNPHLVDYNDAQQEVDLKIELA